MDPLGLWDVSGILRLLYDLSDSFCSLRFCAISVCNSWDEALNTPYARFQGPYFSLVAPLLCLSTLFDLSVGPELWIEHSASYVSDWIALKINGRYHEQPPQVTACEP